ncbi:MAG TPA: hypothetical protein VL970_14470 [Candidatus Acidoferrales bacterium]|nr:hypothetical protein [Candidatus Acidoferrales bacterium]
MKPGLVKKLNAIRENPSTREFILADARDADMAWGVPSPGQVYPQPPNGRKLRTMPEFHEQIRAVARQGIVDIVLASQSTMSLLAHRERLFESLDVTPAVRINDTTDVWCPRGGQYRKFPSAPFASGFIEEAQFGSLAAERKGNPVVNLGLYSITLNNHLPSDRETLLAHREFRAEAEQKKFNYFLEVFPPNIVTSIAPPEVPAFVNDSLCRVLAGIPFPSRPVFLKIPYFGPRALEELVAYDPSVIVGVLGGSSGTTFDAFKLVADAQKYGARAAFFGRKIKDAEDALTFISFLRRIVDGFMAPDEAVKAYHAELKSKKIPPRRVLEDDLKTTDAVLNY